MIRTIAVVWLLAFVVVVVVVVVFNTTERDHCRILWLFGGQGEVGK